MADHNALLLAWSSPVDAASADEFHRFYDETHVPEVRDAVPGIVDVRRYALADVTADGAPATRFLAIYEIKTDDVTASAAALLSAAKGGKFTPNEYMDTSGQPPELQWYTAR
jgi:hypothetical protein